MVARVTYDHADQRRRRKRAGSPRNRITQGDIARLLGIGITAVSDYERGEKPLPFELTPDDYERALAAAITEKSS